MASQHTGYPRNGTGRLRGNGILVPGVKITTGTVPAPARHLLIDMSELEFIDSCVHIVRYRFHLARRMS